MIDLGAAGEATGFVVYVLIGQYVVLIDVNAVGGVELATVEDLLEEQLACLNAGVCDESTPVPDELSGGDALDLMEIEGLMRHSWRSHHQVEIRCSTAPKGYPVPPALARGVAREHPAYPSITMSPG